MKRTRIAVEGNLVDRGGEIMENNLQTAIQKALEDAPERNFVESLEMSFTLKDIDLKNPSNRIQEEVRLPSGRGKEPKIAMFAGGEMAAKARVADWKLLIHQQLKIWAENAKRLGKWLIDMISSYQKYHIWAL